MMRAKTDEDFNRIPLLQHFLVAYNLGSNRALKKEQEFILHNNVKGQEPIIREINL